MAAAFTSLQAFCVLPNDWLIVVHVLLVLSLLPNIVTGAPTEISQLLSKLLAALFCPLFLSSLELFV